MSKHGYYIPRHDQIWGDIELSAEAKNIWHAIGLNRKYADELDGADINDQDNGEVTKEVILRDFFTEDNIYWVRKYPF